jgi:hypothetical protein
VLRREDGTFGFEEWKWLPEETCWSPLPKQITSVIDTLEHALKEAKERIPWISATGAQQNPTAVLSRGAFTRHNSRPVDPARSRVRKQKASQSAGRAIVTKQAPTRYDVLGSGAWC